MDTGALPVLKEWKSRWTRSARKPERTIRTSYREMKTLIRNKFDHDWIQNKNITNDFDSIHSLSRQQQVIIVRMRTGHCRLRSHLHRIGISDTPECPCHTDVETPEHVLQQCPRFTHIRNTLWPNNEPLISKLYGAQIDLETTCDLILQSQLVI